MLPSLLLLLLTSWHSAVALGAVGQSAPGSIDPVSYLPAQAIAPDYTAADAWRQRVPLPNHAEIRAAAADTFELLPDSFDPQFMNPCWWYSANTEPQPVDRRIFRARFRRNNLGSSNSSSVHDGRAGSSSVDSSSSRGSSSREAAPGTHSKHYSLNRRALNAASSDGSSGSSIRAHEGGMRLHCMPYFQILGVSKCGTTDLYHRLTFHPDMVDCKYKGPHFWDESPYPMRYRRLASAAGPYVVGGKYDGSFPAYVGIFDDPAEHIRSTNCSSCITGEASSNTFTAVYSHLRGRTLPKKLNATLAEYLWEATPWARFIVLFRDPVSRYYSAYYYYRNKKLGLGSPEDFHRKVLADIGTWNSCLAKNSKLVCLKMYEPQQLVKGLYAEYMPAWLAVFPRSRMMFLRNEDYQAAPQEHLAAAIKFLGLRDLTAPEWANITNLRKANSQAGKYSQMLPETQQLLRDFYRPTNEALVQVMGGDVRWRWGY